MSYLDSVYMVWSKYCYKNFTVTFCQNRGVFYLEKIIENINNSFSYSKTGEKLFSIFKEYGKNEKINFNRVEYDLEENYITKEVVPFFK